MTQVIKYINDIDSDIPAASNIILIGSKESLEEKFNQEWFVNKVLTKVQKQWMANDNDDDNDDEPDKKRMKTDNNNNNGGDSSLSLSITTEVINSIINELNPGKDNGVSTETWFMVGGGSTTTKKKVAISLCIGILPTSISRHNTRARPHAITSLLKKHNRKSNSNSSSTNNSNETLVVLMLDCPECIFAAGNAVPKAYSLYNHHKNGSNDQQKQQQHNVSVLFSPNATPNGGTTNNNNIIPSLQFLNNTAKGIQLAARLVDAPPNELTVDAFIDEAKNVVKQLNNDNVKYKIIRGKELYEQGLGGIYNVGKGSIYDPAMVILSYHPPTTNNITTKKKKGIALVGKGIVFDTGGMQVKTKVTMPGMKRDMGGAAAILGTFCAAVASSSSTASSTNLLDYPLYAILCLAENMIGKYAMRPDDIITLYSGKTIEINNTDAEGRLVLGDGVAYAAKRYASNNDTDNDNNNEIDTIIDMATLTGAQGVATGCYFGALYCNSEELETLTIKAGKESGDLVHPMPYAPEFFRNEFTSSFADMKNSVKDRSNAQVSCAGQFIGNQIEHYLSDDTNNNNNKWLHIDMASAVYTKKDEKATGYGVALLQSILLHKK